MNLLFFYIPEWFFVAINLLILTALLTKILWKPVNRILDERQAQLAQGMQDAADAKKAKARILSDRAAFEVEMHRETAAQMKQARVRAGQEYDRIIADAEEKARRMMAAARAQGQKEKAAILESAKEEIVAVSIDMTGLLLEASVDSEQNRRLIEAYLSEDAAARAMAERGEPG